MWLTRFAIDRPFMTALLTLGLLLAGVYGWLGLPVDLNPKADLKSVIVTAVYPGATPSTVEDLVAKPLEDAVRVVTGITQVFSVSQESFCYLYADVDDHASVDTVLGKCREAVGAIRGDLPADLREPSYQRLDINAQPVVFLGVIGGRPLEELRRMADEVLKRRLEGVPGVAGVEVLGGRQREVEIGIDRERLVAGGLQMSDLHDPLLAASQTAPGGTLQSGDRETGVRLLGEFASLDDIRGVALPPRLDAAAMAGLLRPPPARQPARAVRLGDLGTVRMKAVDPDIRIRLQQREAVGLIVTKKGDANTLDVARQVVRAAQASGLPGDVRVWVTRNTALTVGEALADVNVSLALGVFLCAATIFVFLRNWRGTIIVAVTLPVCLVGTFAPMAFGGHTLNQMTLLGLALSVGILVDDSIVCLEAITHRLRLGESAADAAFNGRNDIALADTSTTLVDLAVFVPVALMPGVVGQFFRDFGFVVAIAVALSLLTAYTIVPMMAAVWYRRRPIEPERQGTWFTRLAASYQRILRTALDHPWRTLACGWGSLALTALLAWRVLGVDFVPAADLSTVLVNLELPAGASSRATERVSAQAEAILAKSPEVDTLFTTLGRIETGFGVVARRGPQYAQVDVTLTDRRGMLDRLLFRGWGLRRRSDDAVAAEMRGRLHGLPGVQQLQVIPVKGWGGAGAPVDFSLYGQDLDEMAGVGQAVLQRLGQVEGLTNPDVSWRLGQPEVQVRFDRERARELHVYPGAVARELRACLAGEDGLTLRVGEQHVPIRMQLRDLDRRSAADVARIPVGRTGSRVVLVSDVASVTAGAGPTRIDRRAGRRDLNFKAYLAPGVSLGDVRGRIERELDALGIPREKAGRQPAAVRYPALTWGWRGDAETMAASAGFMRNTAILGALLVYGIMAALFNSAIQPLTIMLSVPMAGAGALLLLVLTGSSLSIVSGIGMILLISIVVRNSILLIDYTLQLRAQGVGRREAVEESGARRLRPILMTTLCTILGMLPVALKIGKGAEIRAPMAIAVIGGLALSTLLTLVIIPVTYELVDRWMERWQREAPAEPAPPAPPPAAG